ncbi:SAM-dependent methyltransferase [Brucella endophytica]|uniref:SAM-dependent methyltransferase n=1 Tax=Brucella endophytica TaxID=1963359 RepID=A0A916SBG8_9HYPH|nr:class I SAM-dependent methyltransferase [Brucella endophytica]GGA91876.1 SAM-dependent methyltransferase [Brucella endophytica]
MHLDIIELRSFYASHLGHLAERSINAALLPLWATLPQERLVGLGYALPYLDQLSADTERTFAFMPAGQGATSWPSADRCTTALVFDEELPLPDSSVDRILLVHALEHSENPSETLKEMWRVLAPNGRLVVVVPNRRGVWARFEHTPFGSGRPYSRGQLIRVLREANFTAGAVASALHFPPVTPRWMQGPSKLMERVGSRLWPIFGGVLIIEAYKRLYQGLPVSQRSSRRVFVPVLAPQGSAMQRKREGK